MTENPSAPFFFHQGTAWATSHCHPDSRPGRPCQGLLVMLTVNPSKNTIWPQTVPLKTYKPQEENAKIFETKKTIQQKQSKKTHITSIPWYPISSTWIRCRDILPVAVAAWAAPMARHPASPRWHGPPEAGWPAPASAPPGGCGEVLGWLVLVDRWLVD
jgi:hypothetical protein